MPDAAAAFDLSLVVPAYDEEEAVGPTLSRLLDAFQKAGHRLEIVAVDNGSRDRTGEIIRSLSAAHPGVVYHRVEVNQGYGNGVLQGIPKTRAAWVGTIPADGQVDAEDVVRLFETAAATRGDVVAKVRRRFRMDGPSRKMVSIAYNLLVLMLWPTLGTLDVNGTPKILRRENLLTMRLTSTKWFLDPELMIKAHYMGLRVIELNAFARMRGSGLSHVRASTCLEFLRELLRYRFTGVIPRWRRDLEDAGVPLNAPRAG